MMMNGRQFSRVSLYEDGSCQNIYIYTSHTCIHIDLSKVINLVLLNNSLMSFQNLCFCLHFSPVCVYIIYILYLCYSCMQNVNEICCFMYITFLAHTAYRHQFSLSLSPLLSLSHSCCIYVFFTDSSSCCYCILLLKH